MVTLVNSEAKITCDICHTGFEPMWEGSEKTNQAYRCAATITQYGVYGHYGSTLIDGERWSWVGAKIPDHIAKELQGKKEHVICDDCVQDLIDQGLIELDSRYNYFGYGM